MRVRLSDPDVLIRDEQAADREQIRMVNEAAFGGREEADLVDGLREEGAVLVSLVAELRHRIIGHILFSRMSIETLADPLAAVALAPMAILPEHQRRGVGSKLVWRGLAKLRELGEEIVIVVGHAHYYPRFGFSSEKARLLASPFPAESFMALELAAGALDGVRGEVRYPRSFGAG